MAADPIDERYDEIVRELRALPGAPAELRERVRALGAAADVRRPRRRGLTLAVAAGLVVVAAVAGIVLSSGGSSSKQSLHREKAAGVRAAFPATRTSPERQVFAPHTKPNALSQAAGGGGSIGLPVNPARLADVRASMRLRVSTLDGLSKATSKAMRITRALGGFVQSVEYGTPSRGNGDAYLTVRIPVAHVQQAVVRFTALGTIQSQHIAIRDLQDQSNAEELRILRLRKTAAQLQAKLRGQLTPEERVRLQSQLDAVRGLLRVKTQQHQGTLRQGRLSTFALELTTRKTAAAAPSKPGRIERAARHAFSALSKTIAGVLYALIVLSPLLLLVAAGLWASRYRRRRVEQRLLARA
jgi:Domain of unknown function (DUF4349)